MIKWRIDKNNKIPLYLQLKDLIKFYISTGAIQDSQQLPGVNQLARDLKINFETVRKAYKELEKEGLIFMGRGKGTYATLHKSAASYKQRYLPWEKDPQETVRVLTRRMLQAGRNPEEIHRLFQRILDDVLAERSRATVVFTECNLHQVKEISSLLTDYLKMNVKPVLLEDLKDVVKKIYAGGGELVAIITTGFHISEVREILEGTPVDIHVLITSMSPEAMREISSVEKDSVFGFICRDQESMVFYRDLLETEFGGKASIECCTLSQKEQVKRIISEADVLLVTPPVYEQIKATSPPEKPLFNVFDRIDPMSLKLIKDRLLNV
ncbi:MAG: GntR family transcriptional regulator [Candidatus Aminicenantes bacterium]|nr:GntR family transcriptional regulator [Candidatus Aminicenantes bacterium]